jgi:hypothetical protein
MTLPRRLLIAATAGVLLLTGCTSTPAATPTTEPTPAATSNGTEAAEYLSALGAGSLPDGQAALDAVSAPTGTANDAKAAWATNVLKDWYYRVALKPETITATSQDAAIAAAYDDMKLLPSIKNVITDSTDVDKWGWAVNVHGDYEALGTTLPTRAQVEPYSFVSDDGTEMLGVVLYGATLYPTVSPEGKPLADGIAKQLFVELPAHGTGAFKDANPEVGIESKSGGIGCRSYAEKMNVADGSDVDFETARTYVARIIDAPQLDSGWFEGYAPNATSSIEEAQEQGDC